MATLPIKYQRQLAACRKARGKAENYSCRHCDKQAKDWAHIHGKSGDNPWKDFIPLCRSCHVHYDGLNKRQRPGYCEVIENGEVCGIRQQARKMCPKHYHRWRKHGDPLIKGPVGFRWVKGGPNPRRQR